MNFRTEVDLLGEMKIEKDCYFGIHTQRAIDNFKISKSKISDYPTFVMGMILTKKACALANRDIGTLPKQKADWIISACDKILDDIDTYAAYFPTDAFQGGAGTSVNMNTNEVIANVALEMNGHKKGDYKIINPNDDVNMCQSTNDAYPTGFRVALYFKINALL